MKHKIYSIYDTDMESYSEPIGAPEDEVIINSYKYYLDNFPDVRTKASHTMFNQIATFDDATGKFENLKEPRVVINQLQAMDMATKALAAVQDQIEERYKKEAEEMKEAKKEDEIPATV